MNYSTAVLLVNPNIRVVKVSYEGTEKDTLTAFKTMDSSIAKDDLVVVPTDTRCKMTVAKVAEPDVEVDFDADKPIGWVVAKVNRADYDRVLELEKEAIATIRQAEIRKRRETLAKALLDDTGVDTGALAISAVPAAE